MTDRSIEQTVAVSILENAVTVGIVVTKVADTVSVKILLAEVVDIWAIIKTVYNPVIISISIATVTDITNTIGRADIELIRIHYEWTVVVAN